MVSEKEIRRNGKRKPHLEVDQNSGEALNTKVEVWEYGHFFYLLKSGYIVSIISNLEPCHKIREEVGNC